MKLNWDDLRILLALVRSGSLTRASAALDIDQSTVGRRLTALEAALGTTLFLRSKTGIIPTETGERLVADAVEVERRAGRIEELAASPAGSPTGELRIAGEHWILSLLVARILPELLKDHPSLIVRLHAGLPSPTNWSAASVSLWFEDTPQMGEFAIKLTDVPFAVYARRDLDVATMNWVAVMDDTGLRRAPARFMNKQENAASHARLSSNDPMHVLEAVRQGVGKGLLPVCLGDQHPALRRTIGKDTEVLRPLHLHLHPDTVQSLKIQVTIRLLREAAGALFGPPDMHRKHQLRKSA